MHGHMDVKYRNLSVITLDVDFTTNPAFPRSLQKWKQDSKWWAPWRIHCQGVLYIRTRL